MPSLTTLLLFSGAALTLLIIPGPAVLYIVARSASQGPRAGLISMAGIHIGTLVHVGAAVLGLSAIVATSATAFTTIKLAGAAYLIFLGVQALLQASRAKTIETGSEAGNGLPSSTDTGTRGSMQLLRAGILINMLNPKTAVFFLAFVPQFIDAGAGDATAQLLVLSALFIVLGVFTDGAFALAGGWVGDHLRRSARLRRRTNVATGSIFIGLGVATALAGSGSK